MTPSIPVINFRPADNSSSNGVESVARDVRHACREFGFFYVVGHGISQTLQKRLEQLSQEFFSWSHDEKMKIAMAHGGRAWRGYFPVGEELTSGQPDQKEGLYFGAELGEDHPRVRAMTPLHGANLFPPIDGFRECVLEWLNALTELGQRLMRLIAVSLNLPEDYFRRDCTRDPLILFRIFHYPPLQKSVGSDWSVGEHTDYGLLTILKQDQTGGLQIKSKDNWIAAPVVENSFVCNLGDMLDRMTGGTYRSTPHRVRNVSSQGRLSFPFFFDPGWDTVPQKLPTTTTAQDDADQRWDGASVHDCSGTYGDYVLQKVGRVFPDLQSETQQDSAMDSQ